MSKVQKCLISKDNNKLQIPYADYQALIEKAEEAQRMRQVKNQVLSDLRKFIASGPAAKAEQVAPPKKAAAPGEEKAEAAEEKVAVEFPAEKPAARPEQPASEPQEKASKKQKPATRKIAEGIDIPPIKEGIALHFNKLDESGRLFSVFKQYYTCLNDTCGGTVRVTMKDGFCSLWNYDAWEEFAFVDIFEGHLRIAVDPRYTDAMKALNLCEVPRLLSSRRNLVCVQVDDLNNTMLDILVKAFEEVGLTAS